MDNTQCPFRLPYDVIDELMFRPYAQAPDYFSNVVFAMALFPQSMEELVINVYLCECIPLISSIGLVTEGRYPKLLVTIRINDKDHGYFWVSGKDGFKIVFSTLLKEIADSSYLEKNKDKIIEELLSVKSNIQRMFEVIQSINAEIIKWHQLKLKEKEKDKLEQTRSKIKRSCNAVLGAFFLMMFIVGFMVTLNLLFGDVHLQERLKWVIDAIPFLQSTQ